MRHACAFLLLIAVTLLAAACVHSKARTVIEPAGSVAALTTISATDRSVYEVVLSSLETEYISDGDTLRIEMATMSLCDTSSRVLSLDCMGDRHYRTLEMPWANGTWAFAAFIGDSTRRQLAQSLRANSSTTQVMSAFERTRFIVQSRASIAAAQSAWNGGRPVASVVLSRAGYSPDGYAYVYAVFSRYPGYRGTFGAGMIFLLKRNRDGWELIGTQGVWAT